MLLQQESTCFSATQATLKPSEFRLKLHQKLTTSSASLEIKTKGAARVVTRRSAAEILEGKKRAAKRLGKIWKRHLLWKKEMRENW
ncbi:hypothetical protein QN277_000591 [Acacia crassicarpa]|uniref:Uncharacterized protein n=1 Tax=Acacia crassicarpa TaxID=499986 RepID=A0AAE1N6U8_9FABA|nr:hypothetical protein QN277_000591 [Acacia crassicarpa]